MLVAFIATHYRYATLGSTSSLRWRFILFIVGAATGGAIAYCLLTVLGITTSADATEQRAALGAILVTIAWGGIASVWLIPRGVRASIEEARHNRAKRDRT
jgi:hypothetical protein